MRCLTKSCSLSQFSSHLQSYANLSEGALANKRVDLVAVQPLLPILHNVVIVVVVVAVVVHLALFFGARVLGGNLLGSPFLLRVIHLEGKQRLNICNSVATSLITGEFV